MFGSSEFPAGNLAFRASDASGPGAQRLDNKTILGLDNVDATLRTSRLNIDIASITEEVRRFLETIDPFEFKAKKHGFTPGMKPNQRSSEGPEIISVSSDNLTITLKFRITSDPKSDTLSPTTLSRGSILVEQKTSDEKVIFSVTIHGEDALQIIEAFKQRRFAAEKEVEDRCNVLIERADIGLEWIKPDTSQQRFPEEIARANVDGLILSVVEYGPNRNRGLRAFCPITYVDLVDFSAKSKKIAGEIARRPVSNFLFPRICHLETIPITWPWNDALRDMFNQLDGQVKIKAYPPGRFYRSEHTNGYMIRAEDESVVAMISISTDAVGTTTSTTKIAKNYDFRDTLSAELERLVRPQQKPFEL